TCPATRCHCSATTSWARMPCSTSSGTCSCTPTVPGPRASQWVGRPEEEAMARWEDGLAELAQARGRALVGYAYVLCGDQRLAEDLVQDALVKVFSRLRRGTRASSERGVHPLDGGTSEAYVRRAILTLYLDEYRRRRRWSETKHLVAAEEHARGPASGATARADVAAALGRLTPRERACGV